MGAALNKIVFHPPQPSYGHMLGNRKVVFIPTRNNTVIPAIFINRNAPITVLFSHGNSEDIGYSYSHFHNQSLEWNCNILCYDYSGYGLSSGNPSEDNVYADVESAFNYLTNDLGISPKNIIAYGRSLGSGPSVHIATKENIGGLILQSGVSSIHRVRVRVPFTLPGDMFCNIDKINKVTCPVLVIHGTCDEIVPFRNSQEMVKKISSSSQIQTCWVNGGKHNDLEYNFSNIITNTIKIFVNWCKFNYNYRSTSSISCLESKVTNTNILDNKLIRNNSNEISEATTSESLSASDNLVEDSEKLAYNYCKLSINSKSTSPNSMCDPISKLNLYSTKITSKQINTPREILVSKNYQPYMTPRVSSYSPRPIYYNNYPSEMRYCLTERQLNPHLVCDSQGRWVVLNSRNNYAKPIESYQSNGKIAKLTQLK